ncbi:MAG: M23 family metallopeptidase [Deltaproteobacteria bacterium]|nr:M23 family metallopeptidase [Deltaproteobacteria bacterium]
MNRIAAQYAVPVADVRDRNAEVLRAGLRPGTRLYIPFESSHDWDRAFTGVRAVDYDHAETVTTIPGFLWPVMGYISSAFGMRRGVMHDGIDIVAQEGVPVKCARGGHVIYAHDRIGGYGNMIIIRHADSYSTVYAHLSAINVRKGQFAGKGQVIGKVGQTGHAEGPHLHFEVRNNRQPVNPLLYLQVHVANNILRR